MFFLSRPVVIFLERNEKGAVSQFLFYTDCPII